MVQVTLAEFPQLARQKLYARLGGKGGAISGFNGDLRLHPRITLNRFAPLIEQRFIRNGKTEGGNPLSKRGA